jgi:hypothetical protein
MGSTLVSTDTRVSPGPAFPSACGSSIANASIGSQCRSLSRGCAWEAMPICLIPLSCRECPGLSPSVDRQQPSLPALPGSWEVTTLWGQYLLSTTKDKTHQLREGRVLLRAGRGTIYRLSTCRLHHQYNAAITQS